MIFEILPSSTFRRILAALILTSVEAFLAILCMLVGFPILIDPNALSPESVGRFLPMWAQYGWAAGLAFGGLASLLGIVFSEYRIERAGVVLLMATTGVYALAVAFYLPTTLLTMVTYMLFSLSMAARYWVLGKLLRLQRIRMDYIREGQSNGH